VEKENGNADHAEKADSRGFIISDPPKSVAICVSRDAISFGKQQTAQLLKSNWYGV
jgi:hypothetical protein